MATTYLPAEDLQAADSLSFRNQTRPMLDALDQTAAETPEPAPMLPPLSAYSFGEQPSAPAGDSEHGPFDPAGYGVTDAEAPAIPPLEAYTSSWTPPPSESPPPDPGLSSPGAQTVGAEAPSPQPPAVTSPEPGGDLRSYARSAAQKAGIDPDIFVRQIQQESGFDPNAGSPAGAQGIAQIVPRYHPGVDVKDPYASLDYAARLMRSHLDTYGGDIRKALQAYNAGPGAVASGAADTFAETKDYLAKILGEGGQAIARAPAAVQSILGGNRPESTPASAQGTSGVDQAALDDPDKWALCGPVAAVLAAAAHGVNWTVAEAKGIASKLGLWNPGRGMGGLSTEVDLLKQAGVSATSGPAEEQRLAQDAANGNTPIVSTEGHYYVLQGYDPATGKFDTGSTGTVYRGGSRWLSLADMQRLSGSIQGAAYIDNPASPTPSVVANQDRAPSSVVANQDSGVVANQVDPLTSAMQDIGGALNAGRRKLGEVFPVLGQSDPLAPHHDGDPGAVDVFAPRGAPVVATQAGKVLFAGPDKDGGNVVVTASKDGQRQYYAHLEGVPLVQTGDIIPAGQALGTVGNSGNAEGKDTQLHYGEGDSLDTEGNGVNGDVLASLKAGKVNGLPDTQAQIAGDSEFGAFDPPGYGTTPYPGDVPETPPAEVTYYPGSEPAAAEPNILQRVGQGLNDVSAGLTSGLNRGAENIGEGISTLPQRASSAYSAAINKGLTEPQLITDNPQQETEQETRYRTWWDSLAPLERAAIMATPGGTVLDPTVGENLTRLRRLLLAQPQAIADAVNEALPEQARRESFGVDTPLGRLGIADVLQLPGRAGRALGAVQGIGTGAATRLPGGRLEGFGVTEIPGRVGEVMQRGADAIGQGEPVRRVGEALGGLRDAATSMTRGLPGGAPAAGIVGEGQAAPQPAPTFYSALERIIEEKMPNRASGPQIQGILKGAAVKPDELLWTGFDDFIRSKPGPITKAEALDFLRQNRVEVQEVMKGEPNTRQIEALQREHEAAWENGEFDRAADISDQIDGLSASEKNAPKFGQYTLPGGENYRELLITLPEQGPGISAWRDFQARMEAKYGRQNNVDRMTSEENSERLRLSQGASGQEGYRSSHWDEPNILAHVRFNERVDAQGKRVLFIEEVQSDWHQAGRERGYRGDPNAPTAWQILGPDGIGVGTSLGRTADEAIANYRVRQPNQVVTGARPPNYQITESGAVPAAPFAKTWPELAMKRVIRYAAENGFDRVAWTPGEVQAARYDLAKQYSRINWAEDGAVSAIRAGETYPQRIGRAQSSEELARMVGKELADRMTLSAPDQFGTRFVEGDDLTVGGSGMKSFYDGILRNVADKLGKRFGARVGRAEIRVAPDEAAGMVDPQGRVVERPVQPVHALDITPQMKQSVLTEGQPLFVVPGGAPQAGLGQRLTTQAIGGGIAGGYSASQEEGADPLSVARGAALGAAGGVARGAIGRRGSGQVLARAVERAGDDGAPVRPSDVTTPDMRAVEPRLERVSVADVAVDPSRFQFKFEGVRSESGTTAKLADVKQFNPRLGGAVYGWEDASGQVWVVNGHHRLELAQRTGQPDLSMFVDREADGVTATQARATGALINIAEGQGTPLDVAKFLRDTGQGIADLQTHGVSGRSRLATRGAALANLDDGLFQRVIVGQLPEDSAVVIGQNLPGDFANQRAVADIVQARPLKPNELQALIDEARGESVTMQQESLFGTTEIEQSTLVERARLRADIADSIAKDRRLFGFVAKAERAATLARGENVINVEASARIADESARAGEYFRALANAPGPTSDAIREGAEALIRGGKYADVRQATLDRVRAAIAQEQSSGTARPQTPRVGAQEAGDRGATRPRAAEPAPEPAPAVEPPPQTGPDLFGSEPQPAVPAAWEPPAQRTVPEPAPPLQLTAQAPAPPRSAVPTATRPAGPVAQPPLTGLSAARAAPTAPPAGTSPPLPAATGGASPPLRPPASGTGATHFSDPSNQQLGEMFAKKAQAPASTIPFAQRMAAAMTDDRAIIYAWQRDLQKRLPSGTGPTELIGDLTRVNPDSTAAERLKPLRPATDRLRAAGLNEHDLSVFMAQVHDLDIANDFGRRAYDRAIEQGRSAADAQIAFDRAADRRTFPGGRHRPDIVASLDSMSKDLPTEQRQALLDAAGEVWKLNQETLERKYLAGGLSQAQHQDLVTRYPHYITTDIINHVDPDSLAPSTGRSISQRTKPINQLSASGTAADRLDPLQSVVANTVRSERWIARNASAQLFADLAQADPQGAALLGVNPSKMQGTKEVVWYQNGERKTMRLAHPLAEVVTMAGGPGGSGSVGMLGSILGNLTGPWKAMVTTFNAGFQLVTNPLRDGPDFLVRQTGQLGGPQHLPEVLKNYGEAVADVLQDGKWTQAYKQAGGSYERIDSSAKGIERYTRELTASRGELLKDPRQIAKIVRDVLTLGASPAGQRIEMFPRVAAFKMAMEKGLPGDVTQTATSAAGNTVSTTRRGMAPATPTQAMIAGHNATIPFEVGGTFTRAIGTAVPFLNATTQNAAQFVREMRANPVGTGASATALFGTMALAAQAWNRSDEARAAAYADVPQYLKDGGTVWMMPWAGQDTRGPLPNYLWLPGGRYQTFKVAMDEAINRVMGDATPREFAQTLTAVLTAYSPIKGESVGAAVAGMVPPGISTAIELGQNKDFYRGRAIATDEADLRAGSLAKGTAGAANAIGSSGLPLTGGMRDWRPSQTEYFIRDLFGAPGQTASAAADLATGRDDGRTRPVQDVPVLGGLASRVIRDTGGQQMENARAKMVPPEVGAAIRDAGLRPDEIMQPVGSVAKGIPLSREEHVQYQELMNTYAADEINRVTTSPLWTMKPEQQEKMLRDAVNQARTKAADEVLRNISPIDRKDRVDAEVQRKAG